MIQEVRQAFTDTTMQHEPSDFRDFYKGRMRQLEPQVFYCEADVTAGSADVTVARGNGWLLQSCLVVSHEGCTVVQIGLLTVSSSNRPTKWRSPEPETEPEELPDIFSPPHRRDIIFLESVEIHTASLPRLKPHIPLDPDILDLLSEEEDA